MSKQQSPKLHDVYGLKIKLPVEEFQPTTDIQFNKVEKSERVAGWSIRKPLSSGPLTNEQVHWSVPDLIEKQMVRQCKPLSKLGHQYRVAEIGTFELSLIQTWASKDCLAVVLDIMHTKNADSNKDGSASANFIPTYAVLLRPEDFEIHTAKACKSTLEVRPKQQAGLAKRSHPDSEPVKRSMERSFQLKRLFKAKDDWVLSGSIEVPTMSALDSSGSRAGN